MFEVVLIIDAANEGDSLVPRAESPLTFLCLGKSEGVSALRLLGVLFRMALGAGGGTGVLTGCCFEKQTGQYETSNYQISLPLN